MEEINPEDVLAEHSRIMNLDEGTGTSYSIGGDRPLKENSTSIQGWNSKKSKRKAIADLRKEYELKRFRNLSLQFK